MKTLLTVALILVVVIIYLLLYIHFEGKIRTINNFNLTKEDFDFLIDLQYEMLNQGHVSQAAPRYWVVAGTRKVPTGVEYADGQCLIDTEDNEEYADGLEETIKYFNGLIRCRNCNEEDYEYRIEQDDVYFNTWKVIKIEKDCNIESEEDRVIAEEYGNISDIDDLLRAMELIDLIDFGKFKVAYYRNEHYCYPNTMFLTNRSCKEHIDANFYHYSEDAHSYAMTAWRSPEVERLWNVLDKIDWESLREDIYGEEPDTESSENDK